MRSLNVALAALALGVAPMVRAQTPIGPFFSPTMEHFDSMAAGLYSSFGGPIAFSAIGTGPIIVNDGTYNPLPYLSPFHVLYGRGSNVRIRLANTYNRFGGYFRGALGARDPFGMYVRFYQGVILVATTGVVSVSLTSYNWNGWDLTSIGGYDTVEIYSSPYPPGYVGMDNVTFGA